MWSTINIKLKKKKHQTHNCDAPYLTQINKCKLEI
jgi:hypothetical protein